MPVQLLSNDNSNDPRVISLEMYEDGRANFDMHYFFTQAQASFGGQVNSAPWDELQTAVEDYCTDTGVAPVEVALRFVHCFDDTDPKLYQRLQICRMIPSAIPSGQNEAVFDLDVNGAVWYEIKNGTIATTANQNLEGITYLHSMFYKVEPQLQEMERLADGPSKYVQNLVLPWGDEILQMYLENGSPENAGVNIAACSYTGTAANVEWPHGIVIYLSDSQGAAMLNDYNYISLFHNKGADFATACPPNCNVYIAPAP